MQLVQHLDRNNNPDANITANANFLIIKEAYDDLLDPVKHQQYYDQMHMKKGIFITDVKKLDSCMQFLTKNQLHMVVYHLHCLGYEKLNFGDKQDVETISNNKQYG